ncbi:S8 family peptidase [Mycobacterium simulans]|uniref:S8 family peptidase n=1 Tax=Mycobacterium simulans TaxID=627089 RepID=UPI001CD4B616|nr:S8 family peptidase [Mycobacterium simulans]
MSRQGERLSPQFRELADAFDNERARLSDGQVEEVDPELVLVFDLAGTVKDFRNAINQIEGLEFLSEFLDEESEPDDDFYMVTRRDGRVDGSVQHSLYLVMSNAEAVSQLIRLFERWQADPAMVFGRGLAKFRSAFEQLRAIRRWGPTDRVRDTGLIDEWRERLEVVGQSVSSLLIEIELWYRRDTNRRTAAEESLEAIVRAAGGEVRDRAQIGEIAYHALLVDLPVQQVQSVLRDGADAIQLLNADEIMFVSPYTPMTVQPSSVEPVADPNLPPSAEGLGQPRIALLDGLPFVNHDVLARRLTIDDPDGLGENYGVVSRQHGTAMASLIIHGDLSNPGEPLQRPLYVRPIMRPHEVLTGHERVVDDKLLTDLLHRAIRRMVDGEAGREPAAPSVRIVNLSIGAESRALVRRMSPLGRLIDWLSVEYNRLFIVSAGNHRSQPIIVSAAAATDPERAKTEALRAAKSTSRLRGILPPGDALNALTVGATHMDQAGEIELPDTVWDIVDPGIPALYGAAGPGVGRSVKPDLHHSGGRALYVRPVLAPDSDTVELALAQTTNKGPGHRVAAPSRAGATNGVAFTHGTSNATALVTREASRLFDILEAGAETAVDESFPDPLFHPVLVKALLIHASSWGEPGERLRHVLNLDNRRARRELTAILGYGSLDVDRLGVAATNRAVLIAGGLIGREQRHTYHVPLPISLRAKAEWHRFTVTLTSMAPTVGQLSRYRAAKVFFEKLDDKDVGGTRPEREHHAVRRGTCQHEIIDGSQALVFADDGTLPIHVQCMDDAQRLKSGATIRYGLVVSVETLVATSQTIHEEIRARLQTQLRTRTRPRVQQ